MSATVLGDAILIPAARAAVSAGESLSSQIHVGSDATVAASEVEFAICDCCGLTEECTPAYIERVRGRYGGRWVCGLCAEAVKDEICRTSPRLISADEALSRHMAFCRSFRSSPAPMASDASEHLIAAMKQLVRRSLGSPRGTRSTPNSPRKKMPGGAVDSPRRTLTRSDSCFPTLVG